MEERFRTFTVLITKLYRAIRKIKNGEIEEYGLTNPHVSCLYYLYKQESLTLKELVDICLEDKAILSKAIAYLEKKELIVCDSNQKKRYNSYFKLTEMGLEIAKGIASKIDNILGYASSDISDSEREILYRSLSLISEKLDNYCKKYEVEE
ncbi:MAG: MarR family transcriptional regulator [Clostridia bacterium]|nr:MarR family transcriptional regulator [Clostridia bacterium]